MNTQHLLQTIFEGLIYFYTVALLVAATYLLCRAGIGFYHANYLTATYGLLGSGATFGLTMLTSQYLAKDE